MGKHSDEITACLAELAGHTVALPRERNEEIQEPEPPRFTRLCMPMQGPHRAGVSKRMWVFHPHGNPNIMGYLVGECQDGASLNKDMDFGNGIRISTIYDAQRTLPRGTMSVQLGRVFMHRWRAVNRYTFLVPDPAADFIFGYNQRTREIVQMEEEIPLDNEAAWSIFPIFIHRKLQFAAEQYLAKEIERGVVAGMNFTPNVMARYLVNSNGQWVNPPRNVVNAMNMVAAPVGERRSHAHIAADLRSKLLSEAWK